MMKLISPVGAAALASGSIEAFLAALRAEFAGDCGGEIATYIPELAIANPDHFAIVIATADGRVHAVGDCDVPFTIQSVSKAFLYGDALRRLGRDAVLAKVGVEPTGDAFNSIVLDEVANRPFNPMVNAGAIVVSSLVEGGNRVEREREMLGVLGAFAGREISFDWTVFKSEAATGHRNRAIAYLMLNAGMLDLSPDDALDIYFKQCSALVTCRDLAVMAATLANDGVNPLSRRRVLPSDCVQDVLSVMYGCGMYDYAGQWSFDVGLPAKSGVSGGLVAVAPGHFAVAFYSPRLDRFGNSVRGVKACKALSSALSLHSFCSRAEADAVIRRELSGLRVRSNRVRRRQDSMVLDGDPAPVRVVELQGGLHFATAERVAARLQSLPADAARVILDFRHVTSCDKAAAGFLAGLERNWSAAGRRIVWSFVRPAGPLARLHDALRCEGAQILADLDHALEYFENLVLPAPRDQPDAAIESIRHFDICHGFDDPEWVAFVACAAPEIVSFAAGATIARTGDPADEFFVIIAGSVRVSSAGNNDGEAVRLAALGPGLTFGEMGLFGAGRRTADVVAETPATCVAIGMAGFTRLAAAHPEIVAKLYANIIREQAARLHRANVTIQSLK